MPNRLFVLGLGLMAGCAIATSLLIIALRPLLVRYALARPNARSSHRTPTPQGGGMAIVIAMVVGFAIATLLDPMLATRENWSAVAAMVALAVVGAADDIIILRASPRLALQIVAAVAVVWAIPGHSRIIPFLPPFVTAIVLVLALVWFVNLVNFMDGIDWITVAEIIPICLGLGVLAAIGHAPASTFIVAALIGGSTLGFAPFNRPIAKLFLGDVGSLPLGLVLGWQLFSLASTGELAAAVILPLYYVADATITLMRRLANGERVWEAHRTHFYQRATDRGWSVIAIDRAVFTTNLVLGTLAVASVYVGAAAQIALVGAGCVVVAALLVRLAKGKT